MPDLKTMSSGSSGRFLESKRRIEPDGTNKDHASLISSSHDDMGSKKNTSSSPSFYSSALNDDTGGNKVEDALHAEMRREEENDFVARLLAPYSAFIVYRPFIVLSIICLVVVLSAVLSLVSSAGAKKFPSFAEPTRGFEPRGTTISSKIVAFSNLEKSLGRKELFTNRSSSARWRRSARVRHCPFDLKSYIDGFTLVFEAKNKKNLLNAESLKEICELHNKTVLEQPEYSSRWFYTSCASFHIPNYVALFAGKPKCSDITDGDVATFTAVMKECAYAYRNGLFIRCVSDGSACSSLKPSCLRNATSIRDAQDNAIDMRNIFHFLADSDFALDGATLRSTLSVDVINDYTDSIRQAVFKPLYDNWLTKDPSLGNVKIVGFELDNFKFYLFQNTLLLETALIVSSVLLVLACLWVYSGSFFIGLMTIVVIVFALVISYFVYGRVFDMAFFPFLNLVTLIFLVGVGSDDAFVYVGIWAEAKKIYALTCSEDHAKYLIKWTTHALRHGVLAMFVTSFTTAAAFYANMTSDISSVKCFGLFAGTCVMVNYLLMITMFPAIVVVHDRYLAACMHACCSCCPPGPEILGGSGSARSEPRTGPERAKQWLYRTADMFFQKHLTKAIIRFRFVFVVVGLAFGIAGLVVTFAEPGMRLPSSKDFQMFSSDSPLEQFTLNHKKKFSYGVGQSGWALPAWFVFGIEPTDNGNRFDPDKRGTVVLNADALDVASAQVWLRDFCKNMLSAPFYQKTLYADDGCTGLTKFFDMLQSPCNPFTEPCCGHTFPMDKALFMTCFHASVATLPENSVTRPLYDSKGDVRSYAIAVNTKYEYSDEHSYNDRIYKEIDDWFKSQVANATRTFNSGWWFTQLSFYDLQSNLAYGTTLSLVISIVVAFATILLTTWNVILSVYSILTIAFIIGITCGALILTGWRLNIFESVIFSVAAGLSADFTLHYSVAYRTCLARDSRQERVRYTLSHIGPAVFMGACTTFIAGLAMVPASVLSYLQMSKFLMLIMTISWLWSTFFFLPLCAVIGPTGNIGQLTLSKFRRAKRKTVEKTASDSRHKMEMRDVSFNSTGSRKHLQLHEDVYMGPPDVEHKPADQGPKGFASKDKSQNGASSFDRSADNPAYEKADSVISKKSLPT